jgi:hypothetical protein
MRQPLLIQAVFDRRIYSAVIFNTLMSATIFRNRLSQAAQLPPVSVDERRRIISLYATEEMGGEERSTWLQIAPSKAW